MVHYHVFNFFPQLNFYNTLLSIHQIGNACTVTQIFNFMLFLDGSVGGWSKKCGFEFCFICKAP